MNRTLATWLALLALVAGCAGSDGGPVGSGISASSVSGNVVSVQAAGSTAAVTTPVKITLDEFTGIEATTDSDGTFVLSGEFSGPVTVRFAASAVTATTQIDVPAGSTTVLEDIALAPQHVQTHAVRVLGFFGHVALVDCAAGELLVNDRHPMANQFMIRLSADTVLVNGKGQTLQCSDIHVHDFIAVEGVQRLSDHTVGAITVTVAPGQPGKPGPTQQLHFVGDVRVANCDSRMILIDDATIGRSRLRLLDDTKIIDANRQPLGCGDIAAGDHLTGLGTILVRHPGVIDVLSMTVTPPSS